jgi:hypothetical protein
MAILNNNPLIGASGQSKGYRIERSLRFNSADSAYLNRTPASAGNRRTWTWSGWVKRGLVDANYRSFFSNGNAVDSILFWNDNALAIRNFNGSSYDVITTQVFRDPSAWYHLVIAMDTTQATASNRIKIYVNGVQVTAFAVSTYPSLNYDTGFNTTTVHYLGYNEYNYFNGYMADINFIDGSALTPSSFGETDADTGVWKPKAYSGSYGTNGFYLKFADNSGTTSTTLGKDSSGNSNNWTPNNFSVTAGAGNDSLVDSPTQYGTDTGAGGEVRGNYATLNPLITPATMTIVNGNLDLSGYTGVTSAYGTFGMSSGKWYFEYIVYANGMGGISGTPNGSSYPGQSSDSYAWDASNAGKYNNGIFAAYGNATSNGDIVGVAFDADAGTLVFYKNGVSQGTAYSSIPSKTYFPVFRNADSGGNLSINFGQRPFAYTAPSGFKALCTTNLPTPTIGATATTRADDYFNAVLYTGNGSTQSITGVGFQPDWVWMKPRSNADDHVLVDAVRGTGNYLFSNLTNAEITGQTTRLTSFDSNGFSLGSNGSVNTNNYTYVAWNWKANGAGSSNTQGTITSTVSANTTAGFSIVTYTGNNTLAQSVGHGLGVAPSMIIVKSRSNATNWLVWHSTISINSTLLLNTTGAEITGLTGIWGSATPTSTTFGLNRLDTDNNRNGQTYVAYCFAPVAGYSAFGSYTGNGSTDGPFIYTNFRPKYVLIRPSSAVDSWQVEDAARSPFNTVNDQLFPNTSDAEQVDSATRNTDFLSNGFKLRGTNGGVNGNGTTYIYAAFAEFPFKYTLAR